MNYFEKVQALLVLLFFLSSGFFFFLRGGDFEFTLEHGRIIWNTGGTPAQRPLQQVFIFIWGNPVLVGESFRTFSIWIHLPRRGSGAGR